MAAVDAEPVNCIWETNTLLHISTIFYRTELDHLGQLGNPGAEYESSRDNAGWNDRRSFAKKFRIEIRMHKKDVMTAKGGVVAEV
jgi:Peptidyl-tRNA hydrolase